MGPAAGQPPERGPAGTTAGERVLELQPRPALADRVEVEWKASLQLYLAGSESD